MPRLPKDPETRQRRNKAVTAATLPAPDSPELSKLKAPALTAQHLGIRGAVKPQVQRWWKEIWQSPMAPRWLKSDIEGLYLIALARHQVAVYAADGKPVSSLLSEIRQQEARFGLDVMARRRLDWRIEGPRNPDPQPAPETERAPPAPESFDPRRVLRAVQ